MIELLQGDCLEKLKLLDDNSIDALVTDPPAGIGFMGKEWDKDKGGRDGWIAWLTEIMVEAMRTMKPGAHGLVWALPRTSHWTATALENAGFEVRDCVYHVFGSGFPKSLNVGKAIDKLQGNERQVIGKTDSKGIKSGAGNFVGDKYECDGYDLTKGNSAFEGWGTALKPAVECWWLVRKPLGESTVAKNVLEYGTGALNIDASRIEISDGADLARENKIDNGMYGIGNNNNNNAQQRKEQGLTPVGRWPSHLIHDGSDEILEHFPQTTSSSRNNFSDTVSKPNIDLGGGWKSSSNEHSDSGSAARFFYCAKPSKAERNAKLDGLPTKNASELTGRTEGSKGLSGSKEHGNSTNPFANGGSVLPRANHHPTVKAQSLMRYLITLITPPDGTVLDMFMGSGSTGVAAKALGFGFVGVELEQEYFEIAKARIEGTKFGEPLEFDKPVEVDENQLDLFGGI
jgi:hypothetical protein